MLRRFAIITLALALLSLPLPSAQADDGVGPLVTSYRLSSSTVSENETLYLDYNVTDNDSIAYAQFDFSMGNGTIVSFNAAYDPAVPSGNYTLWHDFTWAGLPPGRYDLREIVTRDSFGNQRIMAPGELRYAPSFYLKGPAPAQLPDLQTTIAGVHPVFPHEGEAIQVSVLVRNNGTANASGFQVDGYLDGWWVSSRWFESLAVGEVANFTFYAWPSAGFHEVSAYADAYGNVEESDESNNAASWYVFVQPPMPVVDLAVEIVGVAHEQLRTDAGNAPHPLGRRTIGISVTNPSNETHHGCVDLYASAKTRVTGHQSGAYIGSLCAAFAPGATRLTHTWDPVGTAGDVTITARLLVYGVSDRWLGNNEDSHDDFVIVGGLGGVVLGLP